MKIQQACLIANVVQTSVFASYLVAQLRSDFILDTACLTIPEPPGDSNLVALNYTDEGMVLIGNSIVYGCANGTKFDDQSMTEQVATCVSGGLDETGWEVPAWGSCRTSNKTLRPNMICKTNSLIFELPPLLFSFNLPGIP